MLLCCSVSRPDKVIFPPPNWSVSQSLREEQDIGPELQHVYEVHQDFIQTLATCFEIHPVKPFVRLNQVFAKNTHLQNYLSVPVGEQRSQCGQPVDIRGQMSSEGSKPSAALPCGDGHRGAAQLLLQTHLQCTETQGEDTHSNTHTTQTSLVGMETPLPYGLEY